MPYLEATMTSKFAAAAAVLLFLATPSARAAEVFMPRSPALSPDGATVVFGFQGDLWRVPAQGGEAVRLTAHPAYDTAPVFSPDGRSLAFASNRFGDDDVFVVPLEGGPPTRLTFAGTGDVPRAFAPDGRTVYFTSRRLFDYPMSPQIHAVPVTGGQPVRLVDVFADEVATADGRTFVYAEGSTGGGRMRYRGTYQRELFTWTRGGDPAPLTANRGYDSNPMTAPDGRIYWLSDQDAALTANVWTMDADGGGKRQLTFFEGDGVRAASLGLAGRRLVLERGTDLYVFEPGAGEPRRLAITVAADQIENPVVVETKTADAADLAVADDGDELALTIAGEIVLLNREQGGRAVVAMPGPALEQTPSFRPGGADTLLLVGDRDGEDAVYLLVSGDPQEPLLRKARRHELVRLTDGDVPCGRATWSPDGRRIAYVRGLGDLHVMKADGSGDETLVRHWDLDSFAWSPDSRWLAFGRADRDFNTDIWLVPAEGGEAVNVTRHPAYDENPVWSPDGRRLYWSTTRHAHDPGDRGHDVYALYLTLADHERTREEWEIEQKSRDDKKKDGDKDKDKDKDKEKEKIVVAVDFQDIHLRGRRLTNLPDDERPVAADPHGDRVYFLAQRGEASDLWSVDRFGEDRKAVTEGDTKPRRLRLDAKGKTFTYLKGGKPATTPADGGKTETVSFTARLTIDRPAVRLRVMDEAWRTLRDRFYDPDMHGVDWPGLRGKYAAWVKGVAHDTDFGDVMNLMLGELNASHMGFRPGWEPIGNYGDDGWLGLEFDSAHDGEGLKVARVLRNGPCDRARCRLQPGDLLLSVDGRPVGRDASLESALENGAGVPAWLTVRRGREQLEFQAVPQKWAEERQLQYHETERERRARAEQRSDGRVGYVHIQGMGLGEVERFQQELFAAADGKEALVIDVRDNGGGWTTDLLLTMLTQPVHAFTISRDGEVGYPQTERQPFYRWSKPVAVICNEGSYSNAEIFSHAMQTIGRGPVVGAETGGNVISTGGFGNRYRGFVRLPFRGWWIWGDAVRTERNGRPQEAKRDGAGCVPDVPVALTPADRLHRRDPQLDRAVDLMLEAADAERRKPQPEPRAEG
jgi:tricorn protease